MRQYSSIDHFFMNLDTALRTVAGAPHLTERPNPTEGMAEPELSEPERVLAGRLMRVNHAGEVSAQGLYHGQALTARLPEVRQQMERAALEENDHLEWCERRINELGSRTSYLNPFWYAGSLAIGATAGLAGDKWSLGFIVETERQVVRHLEGHLAQLPSHDSKSRNVLESMKEDEAYHADLAQSAGGAKLPLPVRSLMRLISRGMTRTAYWV